MPLAAMSYCLRPSSPPELSASAIRPSSKLAPAAVPPARKVRREMAGIVLTGFSLAAAMAISCSILIYKFFSLPLMTFVSSRFLRGRLQGSRARTTGLPEKPDAALLIIVGDLNSTERGDHQGFELVIESLGCCQEKRVIVN